MAFFSFEASSLPSSHAATPLDNVSLVPSKEDFFARSPHVWLIPLDSSFVNFPPFPSKAFSVVSPFWTRSGLPRPDRDPCPPFFSTFSKLLLLS